MNQKDLATVTHASNFIVQFLFLFDKCICFQACMIDISIVQSYENGKAIPNQAIITKIEKALGAKIRPPKK